MFKVFQINLTNREVDQVNILGDHYAVPKNAVRMKLMLPGEDVRPLVAEGFENGYFEHVANIDGTDLENVFEIGNIGPDEKIERLGPMHSLSMGDVVENETGERFVVAAFGFEQV